MSNKFKVTQDQARIFFNLTSNAPLTYQDLFLHLLDAACVVGKGKTARCCLCRGNMLFLPLRAIVRQTCGKLDFVELPYGIYATS